MIKARWPVFFVWCVCDHGFDSVLWRTFVVPCPDHLSLDEQPCLFGHQFEILLSFRELWCWKGRISFLFRHDVSWHIGRYVSNGFHLMGFWVDFVSFLCKLKDFSPIQEKWIWKNGVIVPKTNSKFTPKKIDAGGIHSQSCSHEFYLKLWWKPQVQFISFRMPWLQVPCTFAVRIFWRVKWYHKFVLSNGCRICIGACTYTLKIMGIFQYLPKFSDQAASQGDVQGLRHEIFHRRGGGSRVSAQRGRNLENRCGVASWESQRWGFHLMGWSWNASTLLRFGWWAIVETN